MKSLRKTNFELLRIICMLMIILLHYFGKSDFLETLKIDEHLIYLFSWLVRSICYVAVNCYVLITGYFSINSRFKLEKVAMLWLETFFYSILIYIILIIFGVVKLSVSHLLTVVFPITMNAYWFMTTYILLYLIMPFLNIYIRNIGKKIHLYTCLTLLFIFSLVPTFFCIEDFSLVNYGYSLSWFITLYFCGSYIRIYEVHLKKEIIILFYVLSLLFLLVSKYIITILTIYFFQKEMYSSFFYRYNSIVVFINSVSFFLLFEKININRLTLKRIINFFPKTHLLYI